MNQPTPGPHDSVFTVGENLRGDDRVYGTFPDQRILGDPCTIQVDPLPDGYLGAADILGFQGVFRRDGFAIHISGFDSFGVKCGPGRIKALGMYQVIWPGERPSMAGTGVREPQPTVIVSNSPFGVHADWQHHSLMTDCRYYVTLEGVYRWWCLKRPASFDSVDLCKWMDNLRPGSIGRYVTEQHVSAVRRLLEGAVLVSNNGITSAGGKIGCTSIERVGRWAYRWRDGA